jgi:hypothetical protein
MNTPIVVTVLSWGLWSVACANSSDDPYHACASGWTRCIDANTCVPADSPCPPSSMTVASGPATSDASAPTSDAGNPTPTAYAAGPWAGGDWSEHFPQSPASSPDAGVLPPASTALSWSQVYLDLAESDIVSIWGTSNADVYVGTESVPSIMSSTATPPEPMLRAKSLAPDGAATRTRCTRLAQALGLPKPA